MREMAAIEALKSEKSDKEVKKERFSFLTLDLIYFSENYNN